MLVWAVVIAVVTLSLAALAVAMLKAWRSGKALATSIGTVSAAVEPLLALELGPTGPVPSPLTEAELREREAALAAREAELERRLRATRP